jgi:hypothetical protein
MYAFAADALRNVRIRAARGPAYPLSGNNGHAVAFHPGARLVAQTFGLG